MRILNTSSPKTPLLALLHTTRVTTHDWFGHLAYLVLACFFLLMPITLIRRFSDFTGLFTLQDLAVKAFLLFGAVLVIGLAIAYWYEKYQQRCLPLLETAAGYRIDSYTGESFHHDMPSSSPYYPWLHLPVPFSRKILLLQAGIPLEDALTCTLSDDDLRLHATAQDASEEGSESA